MAIFEILTEITDVEVIAVGRAIRDYDYLVQKFGLGRWRKMKGFAIIKLSDGSIHRAELHWYEASGIGRRWMKYKRLQD